MCALIQVRHLAVCDKHSGIFAFPLSFIALQFGCRGVVAGISPVLLLTCILSWHLYSGSDHITNWNTYARLSDVTLLNKLTPLATQQSVIGFVGITAKDFLRIARDRRWSFLIIGKRLGIDPRWLVFSIKNKLPTVCRTLKKKTRTWKSIWFSLVLYILITYMIMLWAFSSKLRGGKTFKYIRNAVSSLYCLRDIQQQKDKCIGIFSVRKEEFQSIIN